MSQSNVPSVNITTQTGYLRECDPFDVVLPINQEATFSDNVGPVNTISTNSDTAILLDSELTKAQEFQNAEEAAGMPVTNFIIETDGGNIYEFPPNAYQGRDGGNLSFDQTQVITWPGPETDNISTISYSVFSNCTCRSVETTQQVRQDGTAQLLQILDLGDVDFVTGEKPVIATPLEFGTLGPFPGPCPDEDQVLDVDDLCCNDDLATNEPDVAAKRVVWVDAADDLNNLLDVPAGTPIAGNDGDRVGQILDKLGGTATLNRGSTDNNDRPFYRPGNLNNLPGLEFVGGGTPNAGDHLEMNLGALANPPGTPFQLFYLMRATDPNTIVNGCFLGVGTGGAVGAAGQTDVLGNNTWQISRGAAGGGHYQTGGDTSADFVFRLDEGPGSVAAGIDIPIGPWTEMADGNAHLITLNYDGTNARVFFDGELRVDEEITVQFDNDMASQYFRVFGNRADAAYPDGFLYEMFFSDGTLSEDETATVNAYLICKWGIDPSLAAGGSGDLTLAPAGTYTAPTPFVRIRKATGEIVYRNTNNGIEYPVPPVPGLSICVDTETCEGCAASDNVTPEIRAETGAGATADSLWELSITNVGAANGTVDGVAFPPTASVTFRGYHDETNNTTYRLSSIAYDGTGTTLLVTETP